MRYWKNQEICLPLSHLQFCVFGDEYTVLHLRGIRARMTLKKNDCAQFEFRTSDREHTRLNIACCQMHLIRAVPLLCENFKQDALITLFRQS